MKSGKDNIYWHDSHVSREEKEKILSQRGLLLWFTGLSGSGKSTIAHALEKKLYDEGYLTTVLDGDNIRHGLNKNLGFSAEDRQENIRRIGEVGKLFVESCFITLSAFISPYRADRDTVRALFNEGDFVEIYLKCSLEELEKRDTKGLYEKARLGLIKDFTGISAPYQAPFEPEIEIDTLTTSISESVQMIYDHIKSKGNLLKT